MGSEVKVKYLTSAGKTELFHTDAELHNPQRNPHSCGCAGGKHLDIQQSTTLKRNLFINTVVYLEMCCQEGGKKKRFDLRKIKINKNNPGWE